MHRYNGDSSYGAKQPPGDQLSNGSRMYRSSSKYHDDLDGSAPSLIDDAVLKSMDSENSDNYNIIVKYYQDGGSQQQSQKDCDDNLQLMNSADFNHHFDDCDEEEDEDENRSHDFDDEDDEEDGDYADDDT